MPNLVVGVEEVDLGKETYVKILQQLWSMHKLRLYCNGKQLWTIVIGWHICTYTPQGFVQMTKMSMKVIK